MARYAETEYRVGEWFLWRRGDSPIYYRARYDGESGKLLRASLGVREFEEAKRKLDDWFIKNRTVELEKPSDASLADIIRRYWEQHASKLPSHSGNKDALAKWLAYWGDATVSDLTPRRQDEFREYLLKSGIKKSTIQRTINIGKAAVSRAYKRGELQSMPFIQNVSVSSAPPKGRPLEIEELRKLYGHSPPHLQTFIRWMVGTAARPEAILTLHSNQVDRVRGVINLNPEGREQNKKVRATVRLPNALAGEVWDGLLVTYKGKAVKSIKTAWRKSRARAGLDDEVQPYSIRHTAARYMRLQGVSGDSVSQQLGHRSLGVTGIYAGYDPRYLSDACCALDDLLCKVLNKNAS
jgi:integrase